MKKILIFFAICLIASMTFGATMTQKQQIVLYRPEFASHSYNTEKIVFVPVLGTNEKLYAAVKVTGWRLNATVDYNTPATTDGITIGHCYKALILDQNSWAGKDANSWILNYAPTADPDKRYLMLGHGNTSAGYKLTYTIPQSTYGPKAHIKILVSSRYDTGLIKATIGGSTVLCNGKDVNAADGNAMLDTSLISQTAHNQLKEMEVAKDLDTTGSALNLVLQTTNRVGGSCSGNCGKVIVIAAAVIFDSTTEVDPCNSCWIEGLYTLPNNNITPPSSQSMQAYSVKYPATSGTANWMGQGHFGFVASDNMTIIRPAQDANHSGESWTYDLAGTTWSPVEGNRQVADFAIIKQDYCVHHTTGDVNICNWQNNIIFKPGQVSEETSLTFLYACSFNGTNVYSLLLPLSDRSDINIATGADFIQPLGYTPFCFLGTTGVTYYNVSSLKVFGGAPMYGCEIEASTNSPCAGIQVYKTSTAVKKLYFYRYSDNKTIAANEVMLNSSSLKFTKKLGLAGDLDNDCKVDFYDFAIMASNWLVDCFAEPFNPACVYK